MDQETERRPRRPPSDQDVVLDESGIEQRRVLRGRRPGDQVIRIAQHPDFRRLRRGLVLARPRAAEPKTPLGRALLRVERFLIGPPIPTAAELTERVGIVRGLAIFASDNISSSAYATEEIMRVLMLAGVGALALTMPIALPIVLVLAIVVVSYRYVIATYPQGGGSYSVASDNLGRVPGLIAAAALLMDYVLTAAVSVSAGVAALTSAFPELYEQRVAIALGVLGFITLINLRGVRESGSVFAVPVYAYLLSVLALIAIGLLRAATGTLPEYTPPPQWLEEHGAQPLTLLLILRAFASGSVALTGAEAVSNGVPSFQPPEVRNAQLTQVAMGTLFATIFLGLSFLASELDVVPDPREVETIISQMARTIVGQGWHYYLLQFSTAVLLLLAANTAFNGFPRLAAVLARDGYLPRQFTFRGDRLAFTSGIVLLALAAGALIWLYEGSVTGLIPLYTVGVFIAFTLSQAGLVRRWWTRRAEQPGWQLRLVINGIGTLATGVVAIVVGVSKFVLGAWMVLVLIPVLVWLMWRVHLHYQHLATASEPETPIDPDKVRPRVIVPVANLSVPVRQAIAYALALAPPDRVLAVHVTDDEASAEAFREQWQEADMPVELQVIVWPYRSLIGPLLAYVDAVRETHPDDTLTVILPEYVPRHWWEHLLHNQTALRIKAALLFHPGIVVVSVPYHLKA